MEIERGLLTSRTSSRLMGDYKETVVKTPFGQAVVNIGKIGSYAVASIDRYGKHLATPSHKINYRANIWALKSLGVERLVSQNAIGSLRESIEPGCIVVPDDFLDRTHQRPLSLFDDWEAWVRVDMTTPFCPEMRGALCKAVGTTPARLVDGGVFACFEGPRFETRAEIRSLQSDGGDVVGTPLVPEVVMAREAGMCFASLAPIINYATGLAEDVSNTGMNDFYYSSGLHEKVEDAISVAFEGFPSDRRCACGSSLAEGLIGESPPWLDDWSRRSSDSEAGPSQDA